MGGIGATELVWAELVQQSLYGSFSTNAPFMVLGLSVPRVCQLDGAALCEFDLLWSVLFCVGSTAI